MTARQKLRAISDGEIDLPEELKTKKSPGVELYDEDDFKAATLPRHVKINRENSSTQLQVKGNDSRKRQKTPKKGKWKPMKQLMMKYWEQYILGKKHTNQLPSTTDHQKKHRANPHQHVETRHYVRAKNPTHTNVSTDRDQDTVVNTDANSDIETQIESSRDSPKLNGAIGGERTCRVPGLCGLKNLGNTCFMNAIVQCLSNTDALAEYFVMESYRSDLHSIRNKRNSRKFGSKGEITEQLALLLKSLWSFQYGPKLSRDFKNVVSEYGSQYKGSNQHDAQEFLMWLVDKVHEDMNCATKKKYKPRKSTSSKSLEVLADEAQANYMRYNNSFVYDLFQAQYRSSLKCPNCLRQRNTFEPYLCVSLPLPQRNLRLLKIIVVYGSPTPTMVQVGVSLEVNACVSDLRQAIAKRCGIPVTQLVLTEVYIDGFQRSFRDDQPLSEIHEGDNVYAIETPHSSQGPNTSVKPTLPGVHCNGPMEETVYLVLMNKDRAGVQGKKFGQPVAMEASRNLNHLQLQRVILKHLGVRQPDGALTQGPVFKLVVVNNEGSKCHISPDEGRPLCTEIVERMMTVSSDEGGPTHVKMMLEWEVDIKDCLSAGILNEDITEDESVKKEKDALEEPVNGTLTDCFRLYTQEEELSGDDAWHCPYCKKLQHGTRKRLGLWSLPDVLIIHLKRFKHTDTKRTKLLNQIDFPTSVLDMTPHLEKRDANAVATSNFHSLSSWSPWKRSSHHSSNPDTDNLFKLYAVCNHIGSNLTGGHYTAICKNAVDGQWYLYDDTKVTEIAEDKIVTPSAYLLFYQRSNRSVAPSNSASSSTSSSGCDHWVFRMPQYIIHSASDSMEDLSSTDSRTFNTQSPKEGNGRTKDNKKPFAYSLRSQSLRLPRKKTQRMPLASTENLSDGEQEVSKESLLPAARTTEPGITSRLSQSMNVESRIMHSRKIEVGTTHSTKTSAQPDHLEDIQSVTDDGGNTESIMNHSQEGFRSSSNSQNIEIVANHSTQTESQKTYPTSAGSITESHF